jgi:hypothetical protein
MSINHSLASNIHSLLSSEGNALSNYEELLRSHGADLSQDDREAIQEIIGDEKNHAIRLLAMAQRYDGNIAIPDDGLQDAVNTITLTTQDALVPPSTCPGQPYQGNSPETPEEVQARNKQAASKGEYIKDGQRIKSNMDTPEETPEKAEVKVYYSN